MAGWPNGLHFQAREAGVRATLGRWPIVPGSTLWWLPHFAELCSSMHALKTVPQSPFDSADASLPGSGSKSIASTSWSAVFRFIYHFSVLLFVVMIIPMMWMRKLEARGGIKFISWLQRKSFCLLDITRIWALQRSSSNEQSYIGPFPLAWHWAWKLEIQK